MSGWKARVWAWVTSFAGLLLALGILVVHDMDSTGMDRPWSQGVSCDFRQVDHRGWSDKLYHPLSRWSFHAEPSPRVRLVTITRTTELDIQRDPCLSRNFVSRLVQQLNRLGARIIVIDKYYSEESCHDEDVNTRFRAALSSSIAPVVVGRSTEAAGDNESSCLKLSEKFDFAKTNPQANVLYGLTRLNTDTLKLPLRWPVLTVDGKQDAADPDSESLALVAARAYDPGIAERTDVAKLLKAGQHPFAIFMKESSLEPISAMSVMCSTKEGRKDAGEGKWSEKCAPAAPPCDAKASAQQIEQCDAGRARDIRVAGSVVVVGDDSDQDVHPFPGAKGGEISGVKLQANYIEALLDDRFLREIRPWVTWCVMASYIALVYLTFWLFPLKRAMVYCVAGLGAMIAVSLGALLATTYYAPVSLIVTAALVLEFHWLGMRGHHYSERFKNLGPAGEQAAADAGGGKK